MDSALPKLPKTGRDASLEGREGEVPSGDLGEKRKRSSWLQLGGVWGGSPIFTNRCCAERGTSLTGEILRIG